MNRTYRELYASSEEDEYSTESSDEYEEDEPRRSLARQTPSEELPRLVIDSSHAAATENLVQKLFNREYTGSLSGNARGRRRAERAYSRVPSRLTFCLKDIVPHCFLQGHMFMGLSACGQFLLSYKVCCSDSAAVSHYSFSVGYKYTLYFWIYQPHKPLRSFYKCCLFDDHGVDNVKEVSITQWRCSDPRVMIVHGTSEDENEDSYITYVKVPKLGCLECKKLRDSDNDEGFFRRYAMCLKCNLTVHTKYSSTESDRKFDPYTNLICPERILIIANGFFHMLHIGIEPAASAASGSSPSHEGTPQSTALSVLMLKPVTPPTQEAAAAAAACVGRRTPAPTGHRDEFGNNNEAQSNVVARILADFTDTETESTNSNGGGGGGGGSGGGSRSGGAGPATRSPPQSEPSVMQMCVSRKSYEEFVFTCNPPASGRVAANSSVCSSGAAGGASKPNMPSPRGKRRHRIVTKPFRNSITTLTNSPANSTTSPSTSTPTTGSGAADRAAAYEFSEDNEKCEKIAILRKRRLADRKYEFSEDNSENIIPFTKIRSASKSSLVFSAAPGGSHSPRHGLSQLHSASPYASPSSSPHPHASPTVTGFDVTRHCTPPPPPPPPLSPMLSCSSPLGFQQGFRSPPSSSGIVRSPSRHLSSANFLYNQKSPPQAASLSPVSQQMLNFKPLGTLSPLQLSLTKRNHFELGGSMSPNGQLPFLSPRRDEFRTVEVPLQGDAMSEKPVCTKKFQRRYVEEDDAASVITSEEDDCISPGYHTSLPMEVHGSCYSEMQMISRASYQQLRCTSVVIEQHSFDLETFTYYVISTLCQKNQKTYDFFHDWAYELISVCPLSRTMFCLLMAQFSARDELPTSLTNCSNCSNCSRKLDCAFHRRQYECRILFTWNMESGEWTVIDFGELIECKLAELVSPLKRRNNPPLSLAQTAKKLVRELSTSLSKLPDYTSNLRVLDSNVKKSKAYITDYDNMIEFHLKRSRTKF